MHTMVLFWLAANMTYALLVFATVAARARR